MKIVMVFFLALTLAGCIGFTQSVQPERDLPLMLTSTPLAEMVVTLAPAATATPTASPESTQAAPESTAPAAPTSTTAPAQAALPPPTPLPFPAPQTTPFADCAVTPGLAGCVRGVAPEDDAIPGALAFGSRVVELPGSEGWLIPAPVSWLDWSPDGEGLLVESGGEGGTRYYLYSRDGTPLGELPYTERPQWGLDSRIVPFNAARAADGREAALEYTPDTRWLLHVTAPGGEVGTVTIEPAPTDTLYSLVTWAPGTDLLVAQRYAAGNAAMMFGGEVLLIDARTGEKQELGVEAPLSGEASFTWNPAGDTLAFIDSTGGARRLALYDFVSQALSHPLPEGLALGELAWSADGARLAFSVVETGAGMPGGQGLPPEAAALFTGPGIYQLELNSGQVQQLTQAPPGELDGWPTFPPGGDFFLYARTVTGDNGQTADVYARRLADGQEWQLVTGVPLWPEPGRLGVAWQRALDYARP